MENTVYTIMVDAAELLYIARREFKEYLETKSIEETLAYKKEHLDNAHKQWEYARGLVRKLYPDDKEYVKVLRNACDDGERKGQEAYLEIEQCNQ